MDLCRARCILGWSVTGGRWPVIGDNNGDNYENFSGAIRNGADNQTGKMGFGAQWIGYKCRIRHR